MDDKKLLELNKQGLIPGPDESAPAFEERARYCLNLQDTIESTLKDKVPFSASSAASTASRSLKAACARTASNYGMQPLWVPVFFSNAKLTPWHGGCAWIFQTDAHSPTSAFLQLRKHFFSSTAYLGFLHRDEVLAHELSHVGRMCFKEPKFEEFLAYQSSSSAWRKKLGPLIQSTAESLLFVGVLLMILILDLFLFWFGDFATYQKLMWLKLIPLVFLGAGALRLITRHQQLAKCRKALSQLITNPLTVNAILYRLTDREIIAFGKMDKKKLIAYISQEWKKTLRWHLITKEYFHEHFTIK